MTKFYPGTSVSRDLPAEERSWDSLVHQSGKPVLDAELNLTQDVRSHAKRVIQIASSPSGFVQGSRRFDHIDDYEFVTNPLDADFAANGFYLNKLTACVSGFPVVLEYTDTINVGTNLVQLNDPPIVGGAPPDVKRTDFVFLEVWRSLVAPSPIARGTIQIIDDGGGGTDLADGDTVTVGAVIFTARAVPALVTEFAIGPAPGSAATSLNASINNEGTYTSSVSSDTVTVLNDVPGAVGNATALEYVTVTVGAVVLNGGEPTPTTLKNGADSGNKPDQENIYRHGNVLSPLGVALLDDLQDPVIATESTQRVQIQYRIRVTGTAEAVNFKTQPDGFSNTTVEARGTNGAVVAGYPFVPADGATVSATSDASLYGTIDSGLWIAGDGTEASATDLGTVDGFVYAIPICFVFRRNNAYLDGGGAPGLGDGFNPRTNTNGALPQDHGTGGGHPAGPFPGNALVGPVPDNTSDRPDGLFVDVIVGDDILDLRRHIQHVDAQAELKYQIQSLLDGTVKSWAIDTADKQEMGSGSGTIGVRPLVCNEIGRASSLGGNDITSGDTMHGVTVRNFDHVARRFGDWPVVERVVFALLPTDLIAANAGLYNEQINGGSLGWYEGDIIHIDIGTLNASSLANWNLPSLVVGAEVKTFMPPGTVITDVLRVVHDDGHYVTAVSKNVQAALVTGVGSDEIQITLDSNPDTVNGGDPGNPDYLMVDETISVADDGSPRRIFIEVEITYPIGSGTTDTPDFVPTPDPAVWAFGTLLENDPTQRSPEMEFPSVPRFRDGFREIGVEQFSNEGVGGNPVGTTVTLDFVSDDSSNIILDRRISGHPSQIASLTVRDATTLFVKAIDASTEYGSSSRNVVLSAPLSGAGQTLAEVTYFAQDPVPNYGAAGGGYQISVYYRSNAPQTAGSKEGDIDTGSGGGPLPSELTIMPLAIGTDLTTMQTGKGSTDLPFPYASPMDQIPVNGLGTGFAGDWYFAATATTAVNDFNADTGMLNLHPMVPMDGSNEITLGGAGGGLGFPYTDVEFRALYDFAENNGYRPTIMSQPLAGVVRHKVAYPVLAKSMEDTLLFRKGELLLVVFTRFAELDEENSIRFVDTDNRTSAAVYRTKNLLLTVGDD